MQEGEVSKISICAYYLAQPEGWADDPADDSYYSVGIWLVT